MTRALAPSRSRRSSTLHFYSTSELRAHFTILRVEHNISYLTASPITLISTCQHWNPEGNPCTRTTAIEERIDMIGGGGRTMRKSWSAACLPGAVRPRSALSAGGAPAPLSRRPAARRPWSAVPARRSPTLMRSRRGGPTIRYQACNCEKHCRGQRGRACGKDDQTVQETLIRPRRSSRDREAKLAKMKAAAVDREEATSEFKELRGLNVSQRRGCAVNKCRMYRGQTNSTVIVEFWPACSLKRHAHCERTVCPVRDLQE